MPKKVMVAAQFVHIICLIYRANTLSAPACDRAKCIQQHKPSIPPTPSGPHLSPQTPTQQIHGHLLVGQACDQGSSVDAWNPRTAIQEAVHVESASKTLKEITAGFVKVWTMLPSPGSKSQVPNSRRIKSEAVPLKPMR